MAIEVRRFVREERDSVYIVPLCGRCVRLCKIVSVKPVSIVEESEVEVV